PHHVRPDVRKKVLPRDALNHRRNNVPTVARVGEPRARWEQERVVLEDREAVAYRGEMTRLEELPVPVMSDAGQVPRELPRGDGISLLGKGRHIPLDGRVQIELPLLVQQCHRRGRERLRDTADAKLRRARDGSPPGGVRIAEPL